MEGMEATPASTSLQERVTAAVMLKPWVYRELAADGSATGQAVLVAFAYIPSAVGIIPWVGGLVGRIWSIMAAIVAVREIHRISQGGAVAKVLIPVVGSRCWRSSSD